MLIDHDAVIMQGTIAVAIELPDKQSFRMAKGVGGIVDDEIVLVPAASQEAQAIHVGDLHPLIVESLGGFGKIFPGNLDEHLIRLHHINGLDFRILGEDLGHAPIAAADDQHVLHPGMHGHGHMDHHLIVDEFVGLREDDFAIQHDHPAKLLRLKDIYALILALLGEQLLVNSHRGFDILGIHL